MTTSILTRTDLAGPYRINAERAITIQSEVTENSIPLSVLVLSEDVAADLKALGQALSFPEHFGANFDALYDCLCDASVINSANLVLIFEQATRWPEEERDTLIAVLQAVSDEWREQNRGFWVLFNAPKLDLDPLPTL
ncbi:MAG: hypothetical protein RIR18_1474 [Pseudomonadota bacterium]|jgi:RNAse (barnase) inhibitor barstar